MLETIILIFLLALAGAIGLIVRGFVGYRTGHHPFCRRCGFDLFGQQEGRSICNECGGSLGTRRAVVIGDRHRRTPSLIWGVGLLVLVLLAGGTGVWAQVKHVDLWVYAPDSFLLHEASSKNAGARRQALAEATRRLSKNQLGGQQIERLIETCLSYQADRSVAWDPFWGDWIETCQIAGKLSADQWKRYLRQGMNSSFAFKVRPTVHRGEPLSWELESAGRRAGNRSALQLDLEDLRIEWITRDGPVRLSDKMPFGWNSFDGGGRISWDSRLENFGSLPISMSEGTQQFVLHATASVGPFVGWSVQPAVSEKLDFVASTEVVSETQATMELVDRPDLAQAIRQSLSVQISPGMIRPAPVLRITVNNPPIGLSFDVFVRVNGVESKSDSIACPAGVTDRQWGMGVPGFSAGAKGVDIILRSNATPALNSIGPLQAWKGEIEFKNVK